jgi:hypothetical protein
MFVTVPTGAAVARFFHSNRIVVKLRCVLCCCMVDVSFQCPKPCLYPTVVEGAKVAFLNLYMMTRTVMVLCMTSSQVLHFRPNRLHGKMGPCGICLLQHLLTLLVAAIQSTLRPERAL